MKKSEKPILGITLGDLNGIGGEIILKSFEDERMLEFCTPVVFASVKVFSFLIKRFNSSIKVHGISDESEVLHGKFNVVNVWKEPVDINFGSETKIAGRYAFLSLQAATKALSEGRIDVLVTAPINKHNIQSEDFRFPGHTNYLADQLNGESLMLMISGALRVGLLTDHIPVKDVAAHITPGLIIHKIEIILKTLKQDFGIDKPRVAVLGINPHSGDKGVIGHEDEEILVPTLTSIRESGKLVYGPYAADSFFGSNNYKNFHAIMAAYHDQGLIPFKTLAFGLGVNFTAGLSKIRTSPDHGTAFEIAGTGKADQGSFQEAVFAALEIYNNRTRYQEYAANPLKKGKRN